MPDNCGTRADVTLLVRDSQYTAQGISDEALEATVSGSLDRLQAE